MSNSISKTLITSWFENLRNVIIQEFENLEQSFSNEYSKFQIKSWSRGQNCGGGEMAIMRSNVFEKVGVNISTVFGDLSQEARRQVAGTEESTKFYATGISVVAHPNSPHIPSAHFNTRFIETGKSWFGGGADMTPTYLDVTDKQIFHASMEKVCDNYKAGSYLEYSKYCDEYFYLQHRKEPRGIGGIFFDHLNSADFDADFNFVRQVGCAFISAYSSIVKSKIHMPWSDEEKKDQLLKRGRYVEFNLLYDRGTKFGLFTGGNIEAILMSLPPQASW